MKYRLALVEYLNTLPFSEGLRLQGLESTFEVFRVSPSECARLFDEGIVDISLCPIGALPDLSSYRVGGQYCIGADGVVGTVMLLSKVPLEDITAVQLDAHSRTSNVLLQVLAAKLWKGEWDFYLEGDNVLPESCLMIGDKVFANRDHYPYQYDLGTAWKELTGLPMVFAVWIIRDGVPGELMDALDEAFRAGWHWVNSGQHGLQAWQREYLLHNISYPLDASKREAMQLFFQWAESIVTLPVTR